MTSKSVIIGITTIAIILALIVSLVVILGNPFHFSDNNYYPTPTPNSWDNPWGTDSPTQASPTPTQNPWASPTPTPTQDSSPTPTPTDTTWNPTPSPTDNNDQWWPTDTPNAPSITPSPTPFVWQTWPTYTAPTPTQAPTSTPKVNPTPTPTTAPLTTFGTVYISVTVAFQNPAVQPVRVAATTANFLDLLNSLDVLVSQHKMNTITVDVTATSSISGISHWAIKSQQHMELYLMPETVPKVASTGKFPADGGVQEGTSWAKGETKTLITTVLSHDQMDSLEQQWGKTIVGYPNMIALEKDYYLMILLQSQITVTASGQTKTFTFSASTYQVGVYMKETYIKDPTALSELDTYQSAYEINSIYFGADANYPQTTQPINNNWIAVAVTLIAVGAIMGLVVYKKKR